MKGSSNRAVISALLNFFVWGSGYVYAGEHILGALWLVAFVMACLPVIYLGIGFYQTTVAGTSMLTGHLAVSLSLLYSGLKPEAESVSWQRIAQDWKVFLLGTLIAGFASEIANEILFNHWWVYHWPWTLYGIFGSSVGLPLIIGWLTMIGFALLSSYLLVKHTHVRFISAYLISWIGIGFIAETINSFVWNTWHYPTSIWTIFNLFGLKSGILAPTVGYGVIGLITFLGYVLLSRFRNAPLITRLFLVCDVNGSFTQRPPNMGKKDKQQSECQHPDEQGEQ